MGDDFTAETFRTWGATVLAASILRDEEAAPSQEARQKQIKAMVEQVAAALGNTLAVCRQYYIHPAVMEAYLAGDLSADMAAAKPRERLSRNETEVLHLLHGQKM